MLKTYEGGCHCGRVRFRVTGDLARVVECNCSQPFDGRNWDSAIEENASWR